METENLHQSVDLLGRTRRLLAARRQTLREVASGANVTFSWLRQVHRGAIPDPGVIRLQRVHDYLLEANRDAAE